MTQQRRRRTAGEGSFGWKESKGLWVGRVPRPYGSPLEVAHRDRDTALRKWQAAKRAVADGLPTPSDRLTVKAYLRQWLEDVVRLNRAHSTYVSYSVDVRCHILPHLGRHPLSQLEPRHVRSLLAALRQQG